MTAVFGQLPILLIRSDRAEGSQVPSRCFSGHAPREAQPRDKNKASVILEPVLFTAARAAILAPIVSGWVAGR